MNEIFQNANWISPEGAPTSADENITAWFRLNFDLPEDVSGLSLKLAITAHTRYKLIVNGAPAFVGPRKANEKHWFYEVATLADMLKPGGNELLVKVVSFAPVNMPKNIGMSSFSVLTLPLAPMLLVSGGVFRGEEKIVDATTGTADWRAAMDKCLEWIGHPQTFYLGRLERWHFDRIGLDYKDVVPAGMPYTNPYGEMPPLMLKERAIPLMYEEEGGFVRQMPCKDSLPMAGFGAEIPKNTKVAFELDAGELKTAYMIISGKGGQGATVRLKYAECYLKNHGRGVVEKGVRDDPAAGEIDSPFDEMIISCDAFRFESFWFRTFRFLRIEVETGDEALSLNPPIYRQTGYPLNIEAEVVSSAKWIGQLYDISARTLLRCMHETHEDCPFYEQLQYTSDTKLQMDFTYAVSTDTRMARQVVEDYHASQMQDGMLASRTPSQYKQAIPQFSLYFIHMIDALYTQEADAGFVARYRPTMDAVLDYFDRHIGDNGLVTDLGYWDFGDWEPTWERGIPEAAFYGPSTIHNFVYAWTLKVCGKLMAITGRAQVGEEYTERAERIIDCLKKHCFDAATGLFREGPLSAQFSQHAQVFAVLAGALSGAAAEKALVTSIEREDVIKCTYPQQFYLLRSLEMIGRYDLSEGVWREFMDLLPLNLTTLPETPGNTRSDCHAWSALMLYDAPRAWLGVRAGTPGYGEILVKPAFLDMIPDLSGTVPTPKGPVKVQWARENGELRFVAEGPVGTPMVVELPGKSPVRLEDGGRFAQ